VSDTEGETDGRGRFIVFEGGEATGKSTQAVRLQERLGAVLTREPGGTELGGKLRQLLLDPGEAPAGPRAEAMLMAADRAQHVAELIRPALERGDDVVCDRFSGSTLAYQGFGRGLPLDELRVLSDWAADGLAPDLVVLLDLGEAPAAAIARERLGEQLDRFESAGEDFHVRVRQGYRTLAADDPDRWVVVDASGSIDDVAAAVWAAVESRLGVRRPTG
jgi:dTMP kinase